MRSARLRVALDSGTFALPATGSIVVFRPVAGDDLSPLPKDRVLVATGFRPDHDAFAAQGYKVAVRAGSGHVAALVCLPRARLAARALLAEAAATVVPGGLVLVDGQKTDGVDAALRDLRGRVAVSAPVVKAHGRIFGFAAGPELADWAARPTVIEGGFQTLPGVFSADAPDRGSVLLAAALPDRLAGRVIDLGAGWGFLARAVLARSGVTALDLVEAEAAALDCACANISDPRARFHWADAIRFQPDHKADAVVCNPPFHTSRAADPALGVAFLQAATRMLAPHGTLWLVANRALPYDRALTALFHEVEPIGGDGAYRLTRAARPVRSHR